MKNVYKKLLTLGMALLMSIPMTACGGKQDVSTTGKSAKDYVYVPEYQAINESSDIASITISNNTIFYSVWNYDETTDTNSTYIKAMDIGSTEGTKLPIELSGNDNITGIMADQDGKLILIINTYTQGENPEDYTQTYSLKKYDKEGNELFVSDLTKLLSEETNGYIQYTAMDKEGNVYLANGENKIWVLDGQGNELFALDVDGYMQSMGTTKEGKVIIATYNAEKLAFQDIDFANKKLGAVYENIPNSNGNYTIMPGIDKGCLINSGNTLFEYDFEAQKSEEVLNWIDSDINTDSLSGVAVLEDGRILAVTRNYTEEKSTVEMVYLTKKAAAEVADKIELTYGTMYMDSNIKSEIIKFNKTNEKYRIHVKEYGNEDYNIGLTKLNSDLVSGNSPDIIDLKSGNTNQYIEKGILEDLYPYMDKDSEIKREDYVENILKAYEKDGKLYAMLPSFGISTVVGKTSDVGDKMGWNLDQLMTLVKSKPEGTEIFDYASKESILNSMCIYGMDQFVDWETGKCSFDSDSFVKILEFANTFSSDSEYVYDEKALSTAAKIQSGQLLLTSLDVTDVASYQMYESMYGGPITFIGYPSESGTGSAISTGELLLAISSKSKNKDGAWEFIRTFMTSEYQTRSDIWNFPIMKSALKTKLDTAMTPEYYEDETGKQVEQVKTSWGFDDFNVDIYSASQEQVDAINNLINSVDSVYQQDTNMYSIITEEAAAYFAGQKTAKDVANVIQSRVQIYVNENR